MEAQGNETRKIKPYTACSRFGRDVESLYKIGLTSQDISYSLDVPVSFVQKQRARIAKASEERKKFLRTGILTSHEFVGRPVVFTIFQR
jgi:hypothetical protein